jgi:hypothetical protein
MVIGCQSQTTSPQSQPSETSSIQEEVDNPDWERFYNLSEKERVQKIKGYLSKDLDYGTWDEYQVLNFISFICADEPSSFDPYGTIVSFVDTTKLSDYKSALISYYCIPGAGSSGVINIVIRENENNKIYSSYKFTEIKDYFDFESAELKDNQVEINLKGYSSNEVGLCCSDVVDSGKIYFKNGWPVMEFTTFNDYRLYIYNLNYGPVFESWQFNLIVWGDAGVYSQDEIYNQADKYNLKTGEVGVTPEAIIKKACEDFSTAIPNTDLANLKKAISITKVSRMVDNWKEAAKLEKDLVLPFEYMKNYLEVAPIEVISDDSWMEGLREFNMIPASEAEKLYEPLRQTGSKINQSGNRVCDQYGLSFVAPNDLKDK